MFSLGADWIKNKDLLIICKYEGNPNRPEGEFSIVFGQVWENPSGDGETKGKVLAKSVEWMTGDVEHKR